MKLVVVGFCNRLRLAAAIAALPAIMIIAGCGRSPTVERSADAVTLPVASNDAQQADIAQGQWSGWRGENSSGISAETDLPVHWSPTEGVRWKVPMAGRGNSSPVVWGDHVLVTSVLGDETENRLVVYSYNRQNGQVEWKTEAGQIHGSTHNKNGYASASVATDGQWVLASLGSAGLFAFDLATGQRRWKADLGTLEHQWGSASSPVLVGNLVVQLCDSAADSAIVAFDKTTGERVWKTSRPSYGCWTTPVVVEAHNAAGGSRQEIVVNGTGTDGAANGFVIAYDPADGRELWRVKGTTDIVCPTAIVGSDLVVSTSGRNGPIFAIRPGGSGDVTATNVIWRQSHGGAYVPTGVAYRNRLYTVADGGVVSCFNLGNGETVWQQRLKGTFSASLVAGDGHIYATNEYGVVYVLAADDTFKLLATNDMEDRMLATPAIAQQDLFLRTETELYCVGAPPADVAAAEKHSPGR